MSVWNPDYADVWRYGEAGFQPGGGGPGGGGGGGSLYNFIDKFTGDGTPTLAVNTVRGTTPTATTPAPAQNETAKIVGIGIVAALIAAFLLGDV